MKLFVKQNRIFLSLYLLFLIAGAVIIAVYEKGDEIVYINSLHNSFFNEFFKWTTRLAELPAMLLILLIAVFSSYGRGLLLWLNMFANFAVVQVLKKLVFADQVRPSVFFEGKMPLDFVQGLEIARYHSFPSGHTATAFALFFMLNIITKDKRWSAFLFFVALLVGVSRVYLLQHFFRDVYVGSLIGVLVPSVFYLTFGQSKFYNNLPWKNKALFRK
ncbi:MAG: phosphatase PAP2 family protein [Bacteroidota bacterium]